MDIHHELKKTRTTIKCCLFLLFLATLALAYLINHVVVGYDVYVF